jgi:hypothetical protein
MAHVVLKRQIMKAMTRHIPETISDVTIVMVLVTIQENVPVVTVFLEAVKSPEDEEEDGPEDEGMAIKTSMKLRKKRQNLIMRQSFHHCL